MNKLNQAPLFDKVAMGYVLGSIMHQPSLLYAEDKYILNMDDFVGKLNEIIFGAIYNLSYNGAEKITPIDVDVYLSAYESQHTIFVNENGIDFLSSAYEITDNFDMAHFNMQYERLKKFSTLRELKSKGFDISEFYNPDFINQEQEEQRFNRMSINDILGSIRNKIQLIENRNVTKQESSGQYAAKGIRNLIENLKTSPEIGIPLEGSLVNYATRGCRKGKMYMYSAPSGGGKTRTMVGNACSIAYPHIENGKIVVPSVLQPVLFVATEMQADEIQTLILAWISGVNEEKILLNTYTADEEYLINIAVNIMEKYEKNFIIESIPNPSIQTLKSLITNYILHDDVEYIFYDYIFTSVGLMDEFKAVNLREDVVLMMLSNTLKEIAANYNVFMFTGTQLNGEWEKRTIRNANMLRGAKSIADKIDVGMIGVRAPQEELQQVQAYCEQLKKPVPNIVIDVYKNRRGKMCDVKIFRKFDYGTCRVQDIMVTTNSNYQVINEIIDIEYNFEYRSLKDYE